MLEEQPTREAAPRTAVPPQAPAQPGAYRDPVIWAIALATAGAYCVISLSRLLQLNPSSWDLGIYTEYVKQYAGFRAPIVDIRAPGFNLLGDHFTPLLAVLGPFFRVFPSSATLLVAQALLAAVSVFPVAQLAREKLGLGASRGDRGRLRVLLGPAAAGRLRLPRDRVRGAAAGLLAVRAGPRARTQGRTGLRLVGAAAGLRQGGPGLHGGRHRHLPGPVQPARQPRRPAGPRPGSSC